ncbi:MAG: hypothetical protein DRR19_03595 [Candidatus Parabeggiatoa sp. nov. 1]|nr:MAG: hypothetical protein DRR19_03595 [Gammaproteobacteria bacterium]
MHSKIILLTVLILPLPLFATPCDQATRLVIQAYELGHRPSVYAQKKKLLQHALSLCPNHADAHNNLGVVLEKEQHYPQALQHYQRASQIQPNDYQAWVGIGDVYYKQGQLPLSLEAYLHACTRNQHARQRVSYLLRENRYRAADAGNVLNKASLSLLYDKQRLQKLHHKATDCRSVFRLLVSTDSLLETFVIIRNIQF